MKKYVTFFAAIAVLTTLLVSCKDKIDLIGAGKESAVVIGILDASESTHFIKVTRTFIGDGETSSLDIAQIPDSSYFENVDVKIEEVLNGGVVARTFNLVDTIVQHKDVNGVFYGPQQKVYMFKTPTNQPLLSNARYRLTVNVDNGRIVVNGETTVVTGVEPANWANANTPLRFTASGPTLGQYADQTFNLANTGTSAKVSGKVTFHYREFSIGLQDSTDKSITFSLGEFETSPNSTFNGGLTLGGQNFYQTLKDKIPVSGNIEKRVFIKFTVDITGAARDLVNYIEVNKPSGSLAQNKPKYTNLTITEGHNVIGIFSSRFTMSRDKNAVGPSSFMQGLDKKSRRELSIGPLTGALGFCSRHVADNAPTQETWYCN